MQDRNQYPEHIRRLLEKFDESTFQQLLGRYILKLIASFNVLSQFFQLRRQLGKEIPTVDELVNDIKTETWIGIVTGNPKPEHCLGKETGYLERMARNLLVGWLRVVRREAKKAGRWLVSEGPRPDCDVDQDSPSFTSRVADPFPYDPVAADLKRQADAFIVEACLNSHSPPHMAEFVELIKGLHEDCTNGGELKRMSGRAAANYLDTKYGHIPGCSHQNLSRRWCEIVIELEKRFGLHRPNSRRNTHGLKQIQAESEAGDDE
jgi:DNA-directed RNA polymerase specialized sigma24 family protein